MAASSKPSVEIIDFVGNSTKHKLVSSADILGGKYRSQVVERAKKMSKYFNQPVDLISLMERASKIQDEEDQKIATRVTATAEMLNVTAKAKYRQSKGDPFNVLNISPERVNRPTSKVLSERQRGMLRKNGVDTTTLTEHQQTVLHNEMIRRYKANLCTFKQAKILKRYGYNTNVSFNQASQLITRIANNGWKRPG